MHNINVQYKDWLLVAYRMPTRWTSFNTNVIPQKKKIYVRISNYIYDNDCYGCVIEYNCTLISFKIETDLERTSEASALVSRDFERN